MPLKREAFAPNDLVLVHLENKPAFFARIERIDPDYKRGWWQVKLFILALPLQVVTWIIDDEQIRGADFTMGGMPVRIEKIHPPAETNLEEIAATPEPESYSTTAPEPKKQARILSFEKRSSE
ncbi:MAG: hypothetical protein ONB44_17415 [candidate division KSB1 bacterium]|nr:hypothetical protein [candidate division KSB1 bacterium]MDZ7303908.1 hypothetical protein [candidate division KSB1 bacterium]MDZ7313069.1 hypothetical protein [candidate division KSB1 bacterium]